MELNEYYMDWYVRDLLARARAEAKREALLPRRTPWLRPALAVCGAAFRRLYGRWSSAASTGSKPTTARA